MSPARECECTCEAWGHSPDLCRGDAPCTLTAEPRPELTDIWPAANVGEFRLCPACRRELLIQADKIARSTWAMNMEAFGHPTIERWEQAEMDRLRAGMDS